MVDFGSECVNSIGQPWSILTVNVLRFQVLTAVSMKLRAFRDMTPCSLDGGLIHGAVSQRALIFDAI